MRLKNYSLPVFALTTLSALSVWMLTPSATAQLDKRPAISVAPTVSNAEGKLKRLIIKLKTDRLGKVVSQQFDATGKAGIQALNERMHITALGTPVELNYLKTIHGSTQVATLDEGLSRAEMNTLVSALSQNPAVEFAEIDEKAYPFMTPNDSAYSGSLWGLKSPNSQVAGANFEFAWDRTTTGSTPVNGANVIVAVLDTGYRRHADIAANILEPGYDFITADDPPTNTDFTTANDNDGRDADAMDPGDWNATATGDCPSSHSSWHGTHVAGTVAAVGNNASGVIGGAYGAKILPVRVLGVCGGYSSDIQEGMYWAAGLHQIGGVTNPNIAKVINLSLGVTGSCSTSYGTAVNDVVAAGVTVVAATGNDSSATTISSPASCPNVIAVTAHTITGDNATYANAGAGTTISAPGDGILSTANTGTTGPLLDALGTKNGTSMATPHVSAAVALLLQVNPSLSPAAIKNLLTANARAFPGGTNCVGLSDCGAGMLDAFAAVKALQSGSNTRPSISSSGNRSGAPGANLQFTVTALDAEGDTVSFAASGLPAGATFNPGNALFQWANPVLGTHSFTVTPSDAGGAGVAQTVQLTITNTPAASGGGGGGGGAFDWQEMLLLALLAVAALGCNTRRQPVA